MTLKKKILIGAGFLTWFTGAVAMVYELSGPVGLRENYDNTRPKRVAMVVFNPPIWSFAAIRAIYDDYRGEVRKTLRDFWRQPSS